MPTLPLADDFQLVTEAIPGTTPEVYFATEWTAAAVTGRASRVVVSGVVHSATETAGLLHFQLRLEVLGSTDGVAWSPLGAAVDDLIATFVDASGTHARAPNAFASPAFSTAGFAWIRARWTFYPIAPATVLVAGQSVDLSAQAGLERG